MAGPTAMAPYDPDLLVMITYSPLYAGIPFQQTLSYSLAKARPLQPLISALVGGGFIEPFAWGCDAPAATSTTRRVRVGAPNAVFSVADASATSSSAYAAIFERVKGLDLLLPEQNYWPPVASGTQPAAQLFDFGDGGNLENYGLIPLIMRGVKEVLLFINTETPLNLDYHPRSGKATGRDIDGYLPLLFGIPVTDMLGVVSSPDYNQVFPSSEYAPLVQELQDQKRNGKPLVVSQTHTIVQNYFWGAPGGGTIEILYFYLDEVREWMFKLPELVQQELEHGVNGPFPYFPNYKTIDENRPPWSLTQLTPQEVNLLADLTCLVVRNSRPTIESLVTSTLRWEMF
ncbi:MAG: hypothetical protein ACT4OM_13535 [Actinomycetota bacterium]